MNLLFFAPHVALWPHTAPEAYVARALAECGHTIFYLTCSKAETYCASMTARGIAPGCMTEESARICSNCKAGANAIAYVYRFPVNALARYLTEIVHGLLYADSKLPVGKPDLLCNIRTQLAREDM
jgi:uncharacterized Fe-S radical SAM superfamily protein PflX